MTAQWWHIRQKRAGKRASYLSAESTMTDPVWTKSRALADTFMSKEDGLRAIRYLRSVCALSVVLVKVRAK